MHVIEDVHIFTQPNWKSNLNIGLLNSIKGWTIHWWIWLKSFTKISAFSKTRRFSPIISQNLTNIQMSFFFFCFAFVVWLYFSNVKSFKIISESFIIVFHCKTHILFFVLVDARKMTERKNRPELFYPWQPQNRYEKSSNKKQRTKNWIMRVDMLQDFKTNAIE